MKLVENFKKNLLLFLDDLIAQFPSEGDLVLARIIISVQMPTEIIMKYFVDNLLPHRNLVTARNENFFLENNVLFGGFQNTKVNHFKKLWKSNNLDKDDKESIFKWFDLLLKMIDEYSKLT